MVSSTFTKFPFTRMEARTHCRSATLLITSSTHRSGLPGASVVGSPSPSELSSLSLPFLFNLRWTSSS
eukprot:13185505-Heterocapsa_arctica.AAC.1